MTRTRQMAGREVAIIDAVRTPIGRGSREKGYYRDIHPNQLLGDCLAELVDRAGIPADDVEAVIGGCVQQYGEQGANVTRNAWLQAGLPQETSATTVNFLCGSSQQAAGFATGLIASGAHDTMIACGVEHLGHLPLDTEVRLADEIGDPWPPALLDRYALVPQGLSSEMIAERWQISRSELDAFAVTSHERAHAATIGGRFEREVMPFRAGDVTHVTDQGIRPGTSLETLAALRPVFRPDGTTTAGNSSQISDGAAAVLLMAAEQARDRGLKPRARIVDQLTIGSDPVIMLTGPIPATRLILERNGLAIGDVDLIEINEAFASVVIAWERELAPDMERVNVNGGAIALGHALGSTGVRLITTLLHELERADRELGLVTMCCGGGLATATLIQRM